MQNCHLLEMKSKNRASVIFINISVIKKSNVNYSLLKINEHTNLVVSLNCNTRNTYVFFLKKRSHWNEMLTDEVS